jgi:hypothetical protein
VDQSVLIEEAGGNAYQNWMFGLEMGADDSPKKRRSGPQFKRPVVGNTLKQILRGKYPDETAGLIQNWNGMNPFFHHNSGDFADLGRRSRRDDSLCHDLGSMLLGSLSCIGCCDQLRHMAEEISIGEHPHECAM